MSNYNLIIMKVGLKIILIISLAIVVILSLGIASGNTLPGSFLYPFKRLGEKVKVIFSVTPSSKLSYQKNLLEKRFLELKSIVETNRIDIVETTSQRFSYQAGTLATLYQEGGNKEELSMIFRNYLPTLDNLRDHFPANSTYWLSLQQNIDTLNILLKE